MFPFREMAKQFMLAVRHLTLFPHAEAITTGNPYFFVLKSGKTVSSKTMSDFTVQSIAYTSLDSLQLILHC